MSVRTNKKLALEVFNIGKSAIIAIEKIENESLKSEVSNIVIYQLLNGYKQQIIKLTKHFLYQIEECLLKNVEADKYAILEFKAGCNNILEDLHELKSESYINMISDDNPNLYSDRKL